MSEVFKKKPTAVNVKQIRFQDEKSEKLLETDMSDSPVLSSVISSLSTACDHSCLLLPDPLIGDDRD